MSKQHKLEERIGYSFRQPALLEQALTHRSYSSNNYERLEFLGDSILNFTVASELFARFPESSEGDLTRLRAGLVKRATLAGIARDLELGDCLLLGSGELKSGGFHRSSILSDALESVVGAVLLDGGVESAMACISRLFRTRLDEVDPTNLNKDAKTRLQEYLQGLGESVPEYHLLRMQGKSPDQEFEIECRVASLKGPVQATGPSKRTAEQNAAAAVLKQLGVDQ